MADSNGVSVSMGQDSTMIVTFLIFAGVFALIGHEKKAATSPTKATSTTPAKIILGGTIAAAALTLLSHAGEGGRKFAVGLAGVTFASSVLINGSTVFGSVNTLLGKKATTASKPSTPSTPSTPTSGLATVTAVTPTALGAL